MISRSFSQKFRNIRSSSNNTTFRRVRSALQPPTLWFPFDMWDLLKPPPNVGAHIKDVPIKEIGVHIQSRLLRGWRPWPCASLNPTSPFACARAKIAFETLTHRFLSCLSQWDMLRFHWKKRYLDIRSESLAYNLHHNFIHLNMFFVFFLRFCLIYISIN